MRRTIKLPSLIHGVSQLPAPVRAPSHAESCVNVWPSVERGNSKRPPLHHVGRIMSGSFGSSVFTGKIDRGTGEQYIFLGKLFDSAGSGAGSMKIFDLSVAANGVANTAYLIQDSLVHTNPSAFAYLGLNATDVAAGLLTKSAEQIRALSVFDNSYIVNRRQSPTMSGSVFTATRPKGHAYAVIAAGNYGLKYQITLKVAGVNLGGGVGVERTVTVNTPSAVGAPKPSPFLTDGYECWDYALVDFPGGTGNLAIAASARREDVAQLFLEKLTGVVHAGVYGTQITAGLLTVTRIANVLKIVTAGAAAGLDFANFKVSTAQGDSFSYGIWNEIDSWGKLPQFCTDDYVVKVKGAVSGPQDDFFAKFDAQESGAFGQGTWSETAQPADPASPSAFPIAISGVTTPHKLVRRTDDAGGTVTGVAFGKYWTFDEAAWEQIIAGDAESNPKSTCIDSSRHVQDIVYFRDRLCWLYEDGLLASEQGEQLNFFRTTVRALPDKDPIDAQFNTDNVGNLHSAIPTARELLLFGKESQLAYRGDPILSPSSVEAPQVARNGCVVTARPASFEGGVIFGVDLGTYAGLKFLTPSGSNENVYDATNLTLHVPAFITAPLRQVEVSTDNSTVAVLGGTTNTIYVLKQHREGEEILQSAWFSFTIEDASVLGVHFFGTKLYVVSQRTEGVFLEYIDLAPGIDDGGRAYWLHLDRRVTNTTTGVSIVGGATTTITMPYDIEVGPVYEVVTIANSTRYTATRTAARTMTVPVNLTGLAFVAGRKYACTHNFHKPQVLIDTRTGKALVLEALSSVVQLTLHYEDTSYLELYVSSDLTTIGNATVGFQGTTSPLTDNIVAGIGQRLEEPWSVYVSNPTPFPHSLTSAEWLVNAIIRSAPL